MTRLLARKKRAVIIIQNLVMMLQMIVAVCSAMCAQLRLRDERRLISRSSYRLSQQNNILYELIYESDVKCLSQIRMDRQTFTNYKLLCEKGGLVGSRKLSLEEMLAMFLNILAHHTKNLLIGFNFKRLGRTVSKCFHECLKAMIRC